MFSLHRVAVLVLSLSVSVVACADGHHPLDSSRESSGSELVAAFEHGPFGAAGGRQILMLDACDPASFNEAFGMEICTPVHRGGGIPFAVFLDQVANHGGASAWRFTPNVVRVPHETTVRIVNAGGIPHNFVEVEEFGPGIVPILNDLLGLEGPPVEECLEAPLLLPGEHEHRTVEPGSGRKYMCCIHPWMQAVTR